MKKIQTLAVAALMIGSTFMHATEGDNQSLQMQKEEIGSTEFENQSSKGLDESAVAVEIDQNSQSNIDESAIAAGTNNTTLTPAEKHSKRIEEERMRDGDTEVTPRMKASSNSMKFPTQHHRDAYHSLSDKNKKAYDALEDHEQDKVAETYRNGGNHQKTLSNALKQDQKEHKKQMKGKKVTAPTLREDKGMDESPAMKTMRKQQEVNGKKKDDIFG